MPPTNLGAGGKLPRVLIVDDHPVVREGLAAHISAEGGMEVCGQAEDVADALALVRATHPDVAIVDISLKTGNGLELIKRITARDESVRVIVWSMHPEQLYAERAIRAGAMGYLHKGSATADIIKAIRTVLEGKVYLSEELSAKLLGRLVGDVAERARRKTRSKPCRTGSWRYSDWWGRG